jgi:hypothetical protein
MTNGRAWTRFPERGVFAFNVLLWLGFFAAMVAITVGIAIFGEVRSSIWFNGTQLLRWLTFGTGLWLTGVHLHIHLAHGVTRHEFLRRTNVFVVLFAGLAAALTAAGFLLEAALYRMAGWPQTISQDTLFDSAGQVGPILLGYLVLYLVWTVTGAMIAAAYRRLSLLGLLAAVLVGVALVSAAEAAVGTRMFPLLGTIFEEWTGSVATAATVGIGGFAAGLAATWALARDVRLRAEAG